MDFRKVFIRLITKKETKIYKINRTINEESDQQIICYFISKFLNNDKIYEVQKSYEFNPKSRFYIPVYTLIESEKSNEEISYNA